MKPLYKVPTIWALGCVSLCIYRITGALICILLGFRGDWIAESLIGIAAINGILAVILFLSLTSTPDGRES